MTRPSPREYLEEWTEHDGSSESATRRAVVGGVAASLSALAGCATGGGSEDGGDGTTDDGGDEEETTAQRDDGGTTETGDDTDTSGEGGDDGTSGDDGDDTTSDGDDDSTPEDGKRVEEGSAEADAGDDDLDLREANVTALSFERRDGDYRFSVELYHDDDGEDGYANWWQLERPDGEQLGRRTLLHAHGTRRFTRSETVSIPEDVAEVVVRGHDQAHGYGGMAAVVDLESGAVEFVDQGAEPRDFSYRG